MCIAQVFKSQQLMTDGIDAPSPTMLRWQRKKKMGESLLTKPMTITGEDFGAGYETGEGGGDGEAYVSN